MKMRPAQQMSGPPALILGGHANALSVARSLATRGITVRAITHPDWPIALSRYVERIALPPESFWEEAAQFLTSSDSEPLRGSVLLAATDEALSILIEHRSELEKKFRLDRSNPVAQQRMLDKITTYEAARAAGVPTPRYWIVRTNLDEIADELVYPLLIKPRLSHLVWPVLGSRKHVTAHSFREVEEVVRVFAAGGVESFLVEKIPGPDDLLCSYNTYLDEQGAALFDFTKRIIRRHPKNMGLATYHITDHVPGLKERSLRLWRHVGLQGLANAEYKLDQRDGEYKLIECNARFTGGTPLAVSCGLDLGEFVYRQVVGLPTKELKGYRAGVRLWEPRRDFAAYRELRKLGELTLWQWVRSVLYRQSFSLFSWRDPGPATQALGQRIRRLAQYARNSFASRSERN